MKTLITRMFLTFASVCIWGNGLHAQTNTLTGTIPFAFHTAMSSLPQGSYVISTSTAPGVKILRSARTGQQVFVATSAGQIGKTGHPRMVFRCYGEDYFLSELWDGSGNGTTFPVSKAERAKRETLGTYRPDEITRLLASVR